MNAVLFEMKIILFEIKVARFRENCIILRPSSSHHLFLLSSSLDPFFPFFPSFLTPILTNTSISIPCAASECRNTKTTYLSFLFFFSTTLIASSIVTTALGNSNKSGATSSSSISSSAGAGSSRRR